MSEMPQTPGDEQQGAPAGLGAKPYDIQKCAHDAQTALEKLATELGKADVDPQVIKAVSGYADDMQKIASSYAQMLDQEVQAAAQPQQPETMASATDALANDVRRQ